MAPKAAVVPPPSALDFPAAVQALAANDPGQVLQGLTVLAGASDGHFPQDLDAAVDLARAVTGLLPSHDAQVSATAAKLLPRLQGLRGAGGGGAAAFAQPPVIQALWSVLHAFTTHFHDYMMAVAAVRAAEAAEAASGGPGGKGGAKDSKSKGGAPPAATAADLDSGLLGPTKFALDAAIVALLTATASGALEPCTTLAKLSLEPHIMLLKHHSPRIQMQAARLLRAVLLAPRSAPALVAANSVEHLLALARSSGFGAVRVEALVTLTRLLAASPAAVQMAVEAGMPDTLLQFVMDPSTGIVPRLPFRLEPGSMSGATTPTGDALQPRASTPGVAAPQLDYSRPAACTKARLQEASAQLLLQVCRVHHGAVEQLVRLGGVSLVLGLLPPAPLPPLPAAAEPPRSAAGTIFASIAASAAASAASKPLTPPTLGDGFGLDDEDGRGLSFFRAPSLVDVWSPWVESPIYPLPPAAGVTQSQDLQALLLAVLACLLSEPGVQAVLWDGHSSRRAHMQLLHLLTSAAAASHSAGGALAREMSGASVMTTATTAAAAHNTAPSPLVHAAALHCVLQLSKHSQWLRLVPYLQQLRGLVLQAGEGQVDLALVAPFAALLQRVLESRLPPPRAEAGAGPGAGPPTVHHHGFMPNGLSPEDNGLAEEPLSHADICQALKGLAKVALESGDTAAATSVSRALMVVADADLRAPAWPPLPSPPPTPPPPPLPTSQFVWDALGRPIMSDGVKLVHV